MEFSEKEIEIINLKDICRMSTIGKKGWPHSVPVGFIFLGGFFYIPSSEVSAKIRNLNKNNKATIVIDDEATERGIMITCNA